MITNLFSKNKSRAKIISIEGFYAELVPDCNGGLQSARQSASFSTHLSELLDPLIDFWHHFLYPIRYFSGLEDPLIVFLTEQQIMPLSSYIGHINGKKG